MLSDICKWTNYFSSKKRKEESKGRQSYNVNGVEGDLKLVELNSADVSTVSASTETELRSAIRRSRCCKLTPEVHIRMGLWPLSFVKVVQSHLRFYFFMQIPEKTSGSLVIQNWIRLSKQYAMFDRIFV